jgi:uncharacterized membrane protein
MSPEDKFGLAEFLSIWRPRHRRLGSRKKRQLALSHQALRRLMLTFGILALVCGAVAAYAIYESARATASDRLPAIALQAGKDFVYPLQDLKSRESRILTYPVNSERVKVLVQRDSNGVVRVAFASCIACYRFRSDHYLKGGRLICGRCQHAMRIGDRHERMTPDKGCVAVPMPFSIKNGQILVRGNEISQQAKNLMSSATSVGLSKG